MNLRFDFRIVLLAIGAVVTVADTDEFGGCPRWSTGVPVPFEHTDEACDLTEENNPVRRDAEREALYFATKTGGLQRLKDEKTWICPEDDSGLAFEDSPSAFTMKTAPATKWVLRNGSSNPVSVALVDPTRNNLEVSAMDPKVHPPHHDPKAILQPGQRAVIDTALGAILHVRELVRVGEAMAPGRILIRHRPGPMAVGKSLMPIAATGADSAAVAGEAKQQQEAEPTGVRRAATKGGKTPSSPRKATKSISDKTGQVRTKNAATTNISSDKKASPAKVSEASKKATARPPLANRMCNSITKLFVNRSGRPLGIYYAGATNADGGTSTNHGSDTCDPKLLFSLGTDSTPRNNFLFSPETNMYAENTYLGHKFVARLQSDPSAVAEEIVLERTEVKDCARERKARSSADSELSVAADVLRGSGEEDDLKKKFFGEYDTVLGNATKEYGAILGNATNIVIAPAVAEIISHGKLGAILVGTTGSAM